MKAGEWVPSPSVGLNTLLVRSARAAGNDGAIRGPSGRAAGPFRPSVDSIFWWRYV